jgi:hypothetical protein
MFVPFFQKMPLLIVIQSSLSLSEPVTLADGEEDEKSGKKTELTRLDFVKAVVRAVINHYGPFLKLEPVAIVSLSLSFNNILAFIINCNACVLLLSLVSV